MSECQHLLRPLWMVSSPGWLLSSRVGPSSVGELSSGFSQIIKIIITTISFKISVHELWWQLLTVSLGSQQLRWLPGKAEFCNWLENRVWLGLPYFLYCKKSRNQSQNWYWSRYRFWNFQVQKLSNLTFSSSKQYHYLYLFLICLPLTISCQNFGVGLGLENLFGFP